MNLLFRRSLAITSIMLAYATVVMPGAAVAGGGRGIEVALPAYVFPGDPFLNDLKDPAKTPVPPSVIIVNIANGDGDVSILDRDADILRSRVAANGEHVKVIGYVYTSNGNRPDANIRASIDRYLTPRNGKVHYDGIFFDEGTRECGPTPGSMAWRDKYRALREYVWSKIPTMSDLVAINIGTAVSSCYLEQGREAADVFVTFEGTADHYLTDAANVGWAYGWVGGNVIVNGQYSLGTQYDSSRFWHLVYDVRNSNWAAMVNTAFARHAGYIDATDDHYTSTWLNPWDKKPSFLSDLIDYANIQGE
ncbi:MAG TPA: spherulation-specific family 4 protein [Noviherbaspirillum sp.]|nr:spherulation-specific family 4 protein [Noviherbaspirillum sp.]